MCLFELKIGRWQKSVASCLRCVLLMSYYFILLFFRGGSFSRVLGFLEEEKNMEANDMDTGS